MTTLILAIIIITGVFGYLFYLKKSGKLAILQKNYIEAEADVNENFNKYFEETKSDPETFKPIVEIIGSDFIAITNCKQPKNILGSITDTAKTMATVVVSENINEHSLVLTSNQLHYIEYNTSSKNSVQHWVFDKSEMLNLELKKGKLTDNLKQSMSFELRDGGKSGDSINNSQMKKLTFTSKEKKYEFFVYDMAGFGQWFNTNKNAEQMALSQSKDDLIKGSYMPMKLADCFFEEIIKFS